MGLNCLFVPALQLLDVSLDVKLFFCHLKLQESDHQKLFKNTYHNIIYKNHPEQ